MEPSTKLPTPQQMLVELYDEELAKGLYDMKLFVSPDADVSTSERSDEVYRLVKAWREGRFTVIGSAKDYYPPVQEVK